MSKNIDQLEKEINSLGPSWNLFGKVDKMKHLLQKIKEGSCDKAKDSTLLPVVKFYDVVNVQISHSSFSWANGFYAIIEKTQSELKLCQIDEEGNPYLFEDGSFMITCTGVNNTEVLPTSLKLVV